MDYLTDDRPEYDIDDFKELYHLRWCQENAYRDIKYPLCLRKLHSKKYEYQANYSKAIKPYRDFLRIHDGKSTIDAGEFLLS